MEALQEEWKVIIEFPNYEISNLGRVRNIKKNKMMKLYLVKDSNKYKVKLCGNGVCRTRQISKLVAIHFLGWKGMRNEIIVHSDGNTLNNTADNLDFVDYAVMVSNVKKSEGRNTSKYRGVSLHKQSNILVNGTVRPVAPKWLAHICVNSKIKHLGVFDTEEEAAAAYNQAYEAKKLNDIV